ncbi:hypothetical protein NMG60_11035066 [Bertholletia excelsa]
MANPFSAFVLFIFAATVSLPISESQPTCNGIFISYTYMSGAPVPPNLLPSDPNNQPYRFESNLTVLNNGLEELKSWRVYVGFAHREYLVSAPGAVLADGTSLPADVGGGTVLAGTAKPDLKSAVQTAGDENQMRVEIFLVGTQFGVGVPGVPLPSTIYLANDGFSCPLPRKNGNKELRLCCNNNTKAKTNITYEDFQPLQTGDLTIMYDVTKSYNTDYWAQVTISNHNPVARLSNWQLSWDWMRGEFIYSMRGAQPSLIDPSKCLFGSQGEYYKDMDFSQALNCETRPTIFDLPIDKTNDTNLGLVPFCCHNGTILSPSMDSSRAKSAFLMQVYKMPPDLNRTQLNPPQNWNIDSSENVAYQCGPPVRVSPSLFPNPTGLPSEIEAVASWQVVCNITKAKQEKPKCCVSFSAFFNDSVVPCNTCACGCKSPSSDVCSASSPALLIPPEALLRPFENRTKLTEKWAKIKKVQVPNPLPCGDNCGVSINWHLLTDYRDGWTARMTLLNWGEDAIKDWFSVVQLERAAPGYQQAYSFNGSVISNEENMIFFQALDGENYLLGEKNGSHPKKDPRIPGSQQSVILFKKKNTPDINVANRDGFPTKVYFNGEECSLPSMVPSNGCRNSAATTFGIFLLVLIVLI